MKATAMPPAMAPMTDFSKTVRLFIKDCTFGLFLVAGLIQFCDFGGKLSWASLESEMEEKRQRRTPSPCFFFFIVFVGSQL